MQKPLGIRVQLLESTVAELTELPGQFDELSSQFVQMKTEVREDISAVCREMSQMRIDLVTAIVSAEERVLIQMRVLHEDVMARIGLIAAVRSSGACGSDRAAL